MHIKAFKIYQDNTKFTKTIQNLPMQYKTDFQELTYI
jgi:hypothetical protein